MTFPRLARAAVLGALFAAPVAAQDAPADSAAAPPAAVRLDVRRLDVDSLSVTARSLDARLNLDAHVGDLVRIEAGVRVRLDSVDVDIRGAEAVADLRIQLDAVVRVLLEALAAVRETPALVEGAPDAAAGGAGRD
ncbi:hypothetical protein [Rubrivirga litoralis]|uniref:Uncharacterized protein n=1 Tax=Rubrivirga litoralis TaxID=3075598 RepID=A0ABU3BN26_9BACT|nr:hypothetical protein [Rubrivirga sp. F394]MDT0630694.1 hypothetical protein [Rubrivirga sp. F394]